MKGEDEWHPTKGYETALRVFQPYTGILQGVEPKLILDTLFVTSGELKHKVVRTVKAADYMLTFRDESGRDNRKIRFRPMGLESEEREPEAIAIMNGLTEDVLCGRLLIGLDVSDAKKYSAHGY